MLEKLKQLEADGLVSSQRHQHLPFTVWNYTNKCQYQRAWTPETLSARGLILDDDGKVVSRGFQKFFNLQEHQGPLPDCPFHVFDKVDGSLGILYFDKIGLPSIATRGSFDSEQAVKATEIFRAKYYGYSPPPGFTAVFEIVYPENRIVVDYGKTADLFHLGLVSNETGLPLWATDSEWDGPHAEVFDPLPPYELVKFVKPNCEGFVVRYQNGFQVKVKLEEYVRIHRLMFQTSTRSIWDHLAAGNSLVGLLEEAPNEVVPFIQEHGDKLLADFARKESDSWAKFYAICNSAMVSRKAFAERALEVAKEGINPSILFAMLDGKSYSHIIWKSLEPEWVPAKSAPSEAVA